MLDLDDTDTVLPLPPCVAEARDVMPAPAFLLALPPETPLRMPEQSFA